jgi:hypothetical protein
MIITTNVNAWCIRIFIGLTILLFAGSVHAQEILYVNDTENEVSPQNSTGLYANYPTYAIVDQFSSPLSGVSEFRFPAAKFNPGANGCDYDRFTIYENNVEVYSTTDTSNFDIKYLYFENSNYNYTNDTEQWSSFRIEPPIDFNTTNEYKFEIKSGRFYCYFSFLESGSGNPRIYIGGDRKYNYQGLYALLGEANTAPSLTINAQVVNEGEQLVFNTIATDPDGDNISYSANGLPLGSSYDESGVFSWTPGYNDAGSYQVTFTATDDSSSSLSVSSTITITVNDTNRAPILDPIDDRMVSEGQVLSFSVSATDPDGDVLTYSAANIPAGSTFDPETGLFMWTPEYDDSGNYENVEFSVIDDGVPMELDVELVTITVGNINRAPVIENLGSQEGTENETLTFDVTATDPDGDMVFVTASNMPAAATFDGVIFSWTPTLSEAGVHVVTFSVTDDGAPAEASEYSVVITIGDNPTPIEQTDDLVDFIVEIDIQQNVENSYLANLHKVSQFIEDGKITPAFNQLTAFLNKVEETYQQGLLSTEEYNHLMSAGENIVASITGN